MSIFPTSILLATQAATEPSTEIGSEVPLARVFRATLMDVLVQTGVREDPRDPPGGGDSSDA